MSSSFHHFTHHDFSINIFLSSFFSICCFIIILSCHHMIMRSKDAFIFDPGSAFQFFRRPSRRQRWTRCKPLWWQCGSKRSELMDTCHPKRFNKSCDFFSLWCCDVMWLCEIRRPSSTFSFCFRQPQLGVFFFLSCKQTRLGQGGSVVTVVNFKSFPLSTLCRRDKEAVNRFTSHHAQHW